MIQRLAVTRRSAIALRPEIARTSGRTRMAGVSCVDERRGASNATRSAIGELRAGRVPGGWRLAR
jgi:hypothetical protein